MKRGDILEYKRAGGLFYHYGMFIGDNKVIHRDKGKGVLVSELNDMIGDMRITSPKCHRVPTEQAIDTAFKIQDDRYNPLTENCEHFVNYVRSHKKSSIQVKKVLSLCGYILYILMSKQKLISTWQNIV